MKTRNEKSGTLTKIKDYVMHLPDPSPEWRIQASVWGIIIVVVVGTGMLFAVLALSGVFGGGTITYQAVGSPGPVVFSHYSHMWFDYGKYKDCRTCHDKLFAPQKYGTYVVRALEDSPPKKIHIGRDASTLYVPGTGMPNGEGIVSYKVGRACRTCATGSCHDGKESFSRFDCLGCHKRK
jgi:hypothetical protein